MSQKKRIFISRLQGGIAIASFCIGAVITLVCLFVIPPLGEISNSALFAAGNFLVMCGGILGIKASMEGRLNKVEAQYKHIIDEMPERPADTEDAGDKNE